MGRETAILRGRARAEVGFVDTCTIQHPTGSITNLVTGAVTPSYAMVYVGPCKVQGGVSPSGQEVAEAHLAVLSPAVHVPMDVVGVVEEDVITITAAELDPELVGRVFRVQGPIHKSHLTARRFSCTEVTS